MLKWVSGLAFLLMVAGIAGLFYVGAFFAPRPWVIAVQVAAIALMVAGRLAFGIRSFHATANPTSGGVISTGPYRYLRHPIYSAVIYFTAAGVANHFSLRALLFGLLVLIGGVMRMLLEERLLVARYPEYRDYMKGTKRIIPFVL
ncbi:MAG: methyltransferase family protein [Vicinamibacterales bacterium]